MPTPGDTLSGDTLPATFEGTPPGDADLAQGDVVGRYVVLERIGGGGMGVVYAAYDPKLDRKVALKLLRSDALGSVEARDRLLREAQALARLSHPNVVAVHDVGWVGAQVFLAMEYVRGSTLGQWLAAKPRAWREVLDIFRDAGRGLSAAHAAGIVHGDFKPDNVLVGSDGRVRVVDFGIARGVGSDASETTRPGVILGTPAYMTPEQLAGGKRDAQSDAWSFAVSLYEAIYGERPYPGESLGTLMRALREGVITPPGGRGVPSGIRKTLLRALRPKREERFPSMEALLAALARAPAVWRRHAAAVVGTAIVVALSVVAYRQVRVREGLLCRGAEERLSGVWDTDRKRALADAFARSGQPYAAQAAADVQKTFDAYASEWQAMYRGACEATHVRHAQTEELLDLRMGCLSRCREDLGALVDVFVTHPETIETSVRAARELRSVRGCADEAALRSHIVPPGDPAVRAKVDQVHGTLAAAAAFLQAARYREALPAAEGALAEATKVGYAPLQGEAAFLLTQIQCALENWRAAEAAGVQAAAAAERGGDDDTRAAALTWLVLAVGKGEANPARGGYWAELADAAIDRAGNPEPIRALLFENQGVLARVREAYEECAAFERKALAIEERVFGNQDLRTAVALEKLGNCLTDGEKLDEGLAAFQRVLAIREAVLGGSHPSTANAILEIGVVYVEMRRDEEALAYYERARAIRDRALGPSHPGLARELADIGAVLEDMGRYDEALAPLEQSLALWESAPDPDASWIVFTLAELGLVRLGRGEAKAAVALFDRALALGEAGKGERADLASARFGLAKALDALHQEPARSLALAREARDIYAGLGAGKRELPKVEAWLAKKSP